MAIGSRSGEKTGKVDSIQLGKFMNIEPFGLPEIIDLLAAAPAEQRAWVTRTGYPSEEILLQFYDAVPGWFVQLRTEVPAFERLEPPLLSLRGVLEAAQNRMPVSDLANDEALESSANWEEIRSAASSVRELLGRNW